MSGLRARAYAKVNLSLEVLGKRPDGFHEVSTIMQSIDLCDELTFEPSDRLSLSCNIPSLETPNNLVLRAAELLQRAGGISEGASIRLEKRIPEAAGLGGGSSDAAAALMGLERLWGMGLQRDKMLELASLLGSDVAFFLHGGTAIATGRGETVAPLSDVQPFWLVLVAPAHSVQGKTAQLYRRMTPSNMADGRRTRNLADAIDWGMPVAAAMMFNCFETLAWEVFPGLSALAADIRNSGAASVHLSGAGPALFSLSSSNSEALVLAGKLRALGHNPFVARTLTARENHPLASSAE